MTKAQTRSMQTCQAKVTLPRWYPPAMLPAAASACVCGSPLQQAPLQTCGLTYIGHFSRVCDAEEPLYRVTIWQANVTSTHKVQVPDSKASWCTVNSPNITGNASSKAGSPVLTQQDTPEASPLWLLHLAPLAFSSSELFRVGLCSLQARR
jgi:hypothetical protein